MMSSFMKGSLRQACLTVRDLSSTKMANSSRAPSRKTKESLEDIPSLMAPTTKAPSAIICLTETASFIGLMESSTLDSGKLVFRKVLASRPLPTANSSKVSGKMGSGSSGSDTFYFFLLSLILIFYLLKSIISAKSILSDESILSIRFGLI